MRRPGLASRPARPLPAPEVDPFLRGKNSKFSRYYKWLLGAQSHLPERSGSAQLFPCVLPFPEVLSAKGRVLKMPQRGRQRMWAKQSVNTLFAWYNFVTLGCPDTIGDAHEPQAGYTPVAKVRPFAENLLGEYASFGTREVRSGGLDFEGARAYLQDLLVELDKHDINYTDGPRARSDAGMSNALAVDAARVAIPEHAGTVDPLNHLPPERAKVLADLSKLRLPEELWPPVPLSCHRVPECEEDHLARRLLDRYGSADARRQASVHEIW